MAIFHFKIRTAGSPEKLLSGLRKSRRRPLKAVQARLEGLLEQASKKEPSQRRIRELLTLRFIHEASNVVSLGPPGVGKTHLSVALVRHLLGHIEELKQAGHAFEHFGVAMILKPAQCGERLLANFSPTGYYCQKLFTSEALIEILGRMFSTRQPRGSPRSHSGSSFNGRIRFLPHKVSALGRQE